MPAEIETTENSMERRSTIAPQGDFRRTVIVGLIDVLNSEARLLRELSTVLVRQEKALSMANAAAVEESVYAVHRVLHTLSAARARRKSINRMLGEQEDLPLGDLEVVLGRAMTEDVRTARDDLADAARDLGDRLDDARQALQSAISSGSIPS